ncbi:MAG: HD domain-containing protein [Candidatus Paceibacterota bacterium]
MQELIDFFIKLGQLKGNERKRWKLNGLKKVESTASHMFRVAILSWLLAEKTSLDTERIIKIALIHDICEINTEEVLSDPTLLNNSSEEKKEMGNKKEKAKKQALSELVKGLPFQREFEKLYLDLFEEATKEAKFVEQAEKAENYLQALQYWDQGKNIDKEKWNEWSGRVFDVPLFIDFKKAIDRKFFGEPEDQELDKIVDFLIEVGILKEKPRKGWVLIGKENPGTIAEHIYRTAMMAWTLGQRSDTDLNMKKVIKTSLIHDTCEVKTYDKTPYDDKLPEDKEERAELFDRWPRSSQAEKKEESLEKDEREIESIKNLTNSLPPYLKEEIRELQMDYIKQISKETYFVKQINRLEALLQALEYGEEDKRRPFHSWWVGTKELIDEPTLVEFLKALDDKFKHLEEKYPRRELEKA